MIYSYTDMMGKYVNFESDFFKYIYDSVHLIINSSTCIH